MMKGLKQYSIEEEKHFDGTVFPLTLAPETEISTSETIELIKGNKTHLLEKLLKHGAILFRGLPINSASDFNDFVLSFGWKDLPYVGGAAVRNKVVGVVFTANESPPDQPIPFHHEMAQVPTFPKHLFFYCDVEATDGGETPLCLSNVVYELVNKEKPKFVEMLKEKGVRYTRVLPDGDDNSSAVGRGWQSTYLTNDRKVAEERSASQGTSYEWLSDGCLKTVTKVLPAVRLDERTGKQAWFNSIVAAYYGWKDSRNNPKASVTYGDGTPFDPNDISVTSRILSENCVAFKWKKGDVALIDNRLVLHARNSFTPPRRILAALFE